MPREISKAELSYGRQPDCVSWRSASKAPGSLYPVERAGIVPDHFFSNTARHIPLRSQHGKKIALLERIVVAIVGADQQVVFADAIGHQGNIFLRLACHVNSIVTKQIRA